MENKIKGFMLESIFWIILLFSVLLYEIKFSIVTLFTNKPKQRVNFFE